MTGGSRTIGMKGGKGAPGSGSRPKGSVEKADPYKVAQEFGISQGHQELKDGGKLSPHLNDEQEFLLNKATYWSAWRAARNAAAAMLNKAAEMNLTPEQFHALTEVAEEWAYD